MSFVSTCTEFEMKTESYTSKNIGVEEVSQSGIGTRCDNNYDRHWQKCVLRHMGSGTRMWTRITQFRKVCTLYYSTKKNYLYYRPFAKTDSAVCNKGSQA